MKTLNLVDESKSDIKYKISQFPDGQQDVIIETKDYLLNKYTGCYEDIKISSRLNNFKDLELIICTVKAFRRMEHKMLHLYIPYLLGARSDRQFVEGGTSYLVDVIAPIINSLEFESVTVMDVHSDVAAACINNLKVVDNIKLVKHFLLHEYPNTKLSNVADSNGNIEMFGNNFILISPDAGASKKIIQHLQRPSNR
jgi:phosphoribosylpyrophosphate synthetase